MKRVTLAVFALLASCKTKSAPAQPPPAARFCDQNLSGVWLNSSDKRFAYRFTDQNGLVTGEYLQRTEDGGLKKPGDPVTFELRRSDAALAGVMKMSGQTSSGKICPVEYEVRFTDCKPDAVQAVVETTAVIGEDCKRKTLEDGGKIPQDLTEFRFERAP